MTCNLFTWNQPFTPPFSQIFSSPNQLDTSLSPLLILLQSIPQKSCAVPKYASWLLVISFIFPKAVPSVQKVIQRLFPLSHCDECHSQTTGLVTVPKQLGEGLGGYYKGSTLPLFICAPMSVWRRASFYHYPTKPIAMSSEHITWDKQQERINAAGRDRKDVQCCQLCDEPVSILQKVHPLYKMQLAPCW